MYKQFIMIYKKKLLLRNKIKRFKIYKIEKSKASNVTAKRETEKKIGGK